ncbi:MAG TPA: amidohydrolase family protein [Thermoanaerobaculia bacterium]|nr:amidohydrolase family protein [Thermoanaerobaculia bacterium]
MRRTLVLGTILAMIGSAPSVGEDAADLLLRGGVFHTVSPAGRVAGTLAVRAGRIVYLGADPKAGNLLGARTQVIELGGRAVTPGLIDAHSHLLGLGRKLAEVDLAGTQSFEEVITRLRAKSREAAPGSWITGRGWDQSRWPENEFPRHAALSAAVPDHPVWVRRIDGHAGLANARALAIAGITADTLDPAGGKILRGERGEPTGVLIDNAMDLVAAHEPARSDEDFRALLRDAAAACVRVGLTTVTDMGVGESAIRAYLAAQQAGELPLRAALFLTGDDRPLLASWLGRGPRLDPEFRVMVRGVKLYSDGAVGSRGAALVEPYNDDAGNLGLLRMSEDDLAEIAARAVERGFQVAIHAIGDRGNLVSLDALERAFGGVPRPQARCRIEHAQVMRLQDIERLARLGVIASMQPTHATSDMRWAEQRLGARRLAGAYAWRKVAAAGGRLALGSDFPVESEDPRLGLYAAVTRQDEAGDPAGGWLPGERLTREEALRGFTLDAAYSLFLEREVGSLEVGKRADLVVFARDPMAVAEREIPRAEVDYTILDGRVVYQRQGAP